MEYGDNGPRTYCRGVEKIKKCEEILPSWDACATVDEQSKEPVDMARQRRPDCEFLRLYHGLWGALGLILQNAFGIHKSYLNNTKVGPRGILEGVAPDTVHRIKVRRATFEEFRLNLRLLTPRDRPRTTFRYSTWYDIFPRAVL